MMITMNIACNRCVYNSACVCGMSRTVVHTRKGIDIIYYYACTIEYGETKNRLEIAFQLLILGPMISHA